MISTQNFPNCNKRFPQPSKEVANVKTTRKSVANAKQQKCNTNNKTKEGKGGKQKPNPPPPPKRKTPL
jgi:hypothetical protein